MSTAERYVRDLIDLPGLVRNLFRHRELIRTMTWRDFSARYRGSLGGMIWSFVQPLVMMVIYTIVFSLFLKVRFSTDASPFTFSAYLLCGLLPWNAMSEGLTQATSVIRANVNLVKRVVFPLEILPVNLALTAAIQQVVGFALLIPLVWVVVGRLSWTLAIVPIVLAFQLLLAIGLNWMSASLAVYLPDLQQLISLLLTVWMFLTPIFYPDDVVPAWASPIIRLNPMARLVRHYRDAFLYGQVPSWQQLVITGILCFLFFMFGYFWYMHTKKGFADVL